MVNFTTVKAATAYSRKTRQHDMTIMAMNKPKARSVWVNWVINLACNASLAMMVQTGYPAAPIVECKT